MSVTHSATNTPKFVTQPATNHPKSVTRSATNPKQLTPKQMAFIRNYIKCGNATQAYSDSYGIKNMNYNTMQQEAAKTLAKPLVRAEIDRQHMIFSKKSGLSSIKIKESLHKLCEFDPGVLYDKESVPIPVSELNPDIRRCLTKIKNRVVKRYVEDGIKCELVDTEYEFPHKLQCLDMAARISGMYAEAEEMHSKQLAVVAKIMWQAVQECAPESIPEILERIDELKDEVDIDIFRPGHQQRVKVEGLTEIKDNNIRVESESNNTRTETQENNTRVEIDNKTLVKPGVDNTRIEIVQLEKAVNIDQNVDRKNLSANSGDKPAGPPVGLRIELITGEEGDHYQPDTPIDPLDCPF